MIDTAVVTWTSNGRSSIGAGKWPTVEAHAAAWRTSIGLLRRHFENVVLVYDRNSAIPEELRGLDYTRTEAAIEPGTPWGLAKIKAQQLLLAENTPYVHVDGNDFFLFDFPAQFRTAPVLAQCTESVDMFYHEIANSHPMELPLAKWVYNVGIVGGTDIDALQSYTQTAADLLEGVSPERVYDLVPKYMREAGTQPHQFEIFWFLLAEQYLLGTLDAPVTTMGGLRTFESPGLYTHLAGSGSVSDPRCLRDLANELRKCDVDPDLIWSLTGVDCHADHAIRTSH